MFTYCWKICLQINVNIWITDWELRAYYFSKFTVVCLIYFWTLGYVYPDGMCYNDQCEWDVFPDQANIKSMKVKHCKRVKSFLFLFGKKKTHTLYCLQPFSVSLWLVITSSNSTKTVTSKEAQNISQYLVENESVCQYQCIPKGNITDHCPQYILKLSLP